MQLEAEVEGQLEVVVGKGVIDGRDKLGGRGGRRGERRSVLGRGGEKLGD